MPVAATNPQIVPRPFFNISGLFPDILVSHTDAAYLNKTVLRATDSNLPPPKQSTGFGFWKLKIVNKTGEDPVFGPDHFKQGIKFNCFSQNLILDSKPVKLEQIPTVFCLSILMPCTTYLIMTHSISHDFR